MVYNIASTQGVKPSLIGQSIMPYLPTLVASPTLEATTPTPRVDQRTPIVVTIRKREDGIVTRVLFYRKRFLNELVFSEVVHQGRLLLFLDFLPFFLPESLILLRKLLLAY